LADFPSFFMNKFQKFIQRLIGLDQKQDRPNIIPFTPTATFGMSEPPQYDLGAQLQSYSSWVYACIRKISSEIANIKLRLYKRKSDGKIEEVKKHDVLDLLDGVNEFMTRYDLFELLGIYLELAGEAFWWKLKNDSGKIVSIYPWLSPANMNVVPSAENFVEGYIYRVPGSGKEITFDADEIIHFKYPNPLNPYRGLSPVKAAEIAITSDREAAKWNWNFFRNSATPRGVLELEGTLSQDQFDRIKAQWESMHQGGRNAHKLAILEGGGKFKEIGFKQTDMDFVALRKYSRDEIFAIFGIPKGVISAEDINRAVAEAHKAVFIEETIVPKLRKIVSYLNEFLLPDYGDDTLFFDFDDPSPRNIEIALKYYESGIKNGWLAPNEVREEEGYKGFEGGDNLFLPLNMVSIGQVKEKGKMMLNVKRIRRPMQEKISDMVSEEMKKKFDKITKEFKKNQGKKKIGKKKINKFSEEFKEAFWKRFVIRLNREERIIKENLIKQFNRQQREVLESVKSVKQIDFDFDVEKEKEIFVEIFKPILTTFIAEHGEETLTMLGLEGFDVSSNKVLEFLRKDGLKFAKEVNKVTREEILSEVNEGVSEGEGIVEIKNRIKKVFKRAKTTRAFAIARSESSRAANFAIVEGYRQSGVVKGKEWLTALDERTCPYCSSLNGKIVSLEDNYFNQGDSFKPTGAERPLNIDYSNVGEPPLHTNCRCTTIPVLKE